MTTDPFALFDRWYAEARASELLMGAGVAMELHDGLMSSVAPGWKMRVLLAHLSQENNLPSLALNTVAEILKKQDNRHKIDLKVASQEKIVIL